MNSMHIAILAGGGGTRLWPLSRTRSPKQFLRLAGERSLLQATADRLLPLTGWDRIYVVTGRDYAEPTREHLPELPAGNLLLEPTGRGTAIAIGLAALEIARRDPDAVMASVGSDHLVADPAAFRRCLSAAAAAARRGNYLVTVGVRPSLPHTGYGYIRTGAERFRAEGSPILAVEGFKEKPDRDTARLYLATGRYLWNTSYFVWRVSSILDALARHAPRVHVGLGRIAAALGTPAEDEVIAEVYRHLPAEPIDTAVMERADNILTVSGEFGWSDVGSWADVYPVATEREGNFVLGGAGGQVLAVESEGCLFQTSGRLVAAVGLKDVVVVDTDDVVLVCPRDRAQEVRRLVEHLRGEGRVEFT